MDWHTQHCKNASIQIFKLNSAPLVAEIYAMLLSNVVSILLEPCLIFFPVLLYRHYFSFPSIADSVC